MTISKNYSMMLLKGLTILLLGTFTFSSCKKDNDSPPPPSAFTIEGAYTAKYGFGNDVPDVPEKYKINSGGVFQQISIHNGSVVSTGTWVINGTQFTASFTSIFPPYSVELISATFDNSSGKLTGTWGSDPSYTNGGKIELTRQ